MDGWDAFAAELARGASEGTLDAAMRAFNGAGSDLLTIRALAARVERAQAAAAPQQMLLALRQRLFAAFERVALGDPSAVSTDAALAGASLARDGLDDAPAAARMLLLALRNAADDNALLRRAVNAAGAVAGSTALLEQALKRPALKADPVQSALCRHALARVYELDGDPDRAFFTALRAAKKLPNATHLVDDVFRLSLVVKRHAETAAFLQDLAQNEALGPRVRASLFNKLGQTHEALGAPTEALAAYVDALRLHPAKAPRRHAERLATALGVSLDADDAAARETPITAQEPQDVTPSFAPNRKLLSEQRGRRARAGSNDSQPPVVMGVPAPPDREEDQQPPAPPPSTRRLPPPVPPDSDPGSGAPAAAQVDDDVNGFIDVPFTTSSEVPRQSTEGRGNDARSAEARGTAAAGGGPARTGKKKRTRRSASGAPSDEAAAAATAPVTRSATDATAAIAAAAARKTSAERAVVARADPAAIAFDQSVQQAIEQGAPAHCVDLGQRLAQSAGPLDPRVLLLAGRALRASAPSGALPPAAVALFTKAAAVFPEAAVSLGLEVVGALPADSVRGYPALWLAAAQGAGQDVQAAHALLRTTAIDDAPGGPAFTALAGILQQHQRDDLLDTIFEEALAHPRGAVARAALLRRRLAHLESTQRLRATVALHRELALLEGATSQRALPAARDAFRGHATDGERAQFLADLLTVLPAAPAADVALELLDHSVARSDRVRAEHAARVLLKLRPGDVRAMLTLFSVFRDDVARRDELLALATEAIAAAQARKGGRADAAAIAERVVGLFAADASRAPGGNASEHVVTGAEADAWAQLARLTRDDAHIARAEQGLVKSGRADSAVAFLDELAQHNDGNLDGKVDPLQPSRLLLQAALLCRAPLGQPGRARDLLERALERAPRMTAALEALAAVLVEVGQAAPALQALDRLAACCPPAERGRVWMRKGDVARDLLLDPARALQAYREAVDADPALLPAWEAMRDLARRRAETGMLREALTRIAALAPAPSERATALVELAIHARDVQADAAQAERLFLAALTADPSDAAALAGALRMVARRVLGATDIDSALEAPPHALLAEMRPVFATAALDAELPVAHERLRALVQASEGDRAGALARLDALVARAPNDLATLLAAAKVYALGSIDDRPQQRAVLLQRIMAEHADRLTPPMRVELHATLALLWWRALDKRAHGAAVATLDAAPTAELQALVGTPALEACVAALEAQSTGRSPLHLVRALRQLAARTADAPTRAARLEQAAHVARRELNDAALARTLLHEAQLAQPDAPHLRDADVDADAAVDAAAALLRLREKLRFEVKPNRRAELHLRAYTLRREAGETIESATDDLRMAVELDARNPQILAAAEELFVHKGDFDALDQLYSGRLKLLDRDDVTVRAGLLERLAQLRRYDKRDRAGAIEALEAQAALLPDAIKPREDAARLYGEIGMHKEAAQTWRAVLDRDVMALEAWRGLLRAAAEARAGDELFATAQTMLALDICDEETARVVRTVRPPFPRWPIPTKDTAATRRQLAHPLERFAIRSVLDLVGTELVPHYGRTLTELGYVARDALREKQIPTSVLLAVRTLASLLGLPRVPLLFVNRAPASSDGAAFAVLPAAEPALLVAEDVLKGGMTPERAFALGRAMAWLQPHALLAATLDAQTLLDICEGLVAALLGATHADKPSPELDDLGGHLVHIVMAPHSGDALARHRAELSGALRDYVHARARLSMSDWRAGVGYTCDRYGFLLAADLNAAFRVLRGAGAGVAPSAAARLSIKELVLFSVSPAYLALRRDLSLALPEATAAPLFAAL